MKKNSYLTVAAVVLILVAAAGGYYYFFMKEKFPVIAEPTPFELTNAVDGKQFSSEDGKVKVLTFFYSNCPDICPLTLNDYRKLEKQLRAEELYGTDVELVAVTVDPKVDTQKVLKKYASNFEANAEGWKVLTGDDVVIDRLTRQLNFYYSKAESGLVTHGTQMFILDRDNKVRAISSMAKTTDEPVDLEEVMTSVKQLAKE